MDSNFALRVCINERHAGFFWYNDAMRLTVNGKEIHFEGITVRQLLEQLYLADRPVAVERNRQIVSYVTFDHTELNDGDSLEVVTLVGGG